MENYSHLLATKMRESSYSEEYIKLCVHYVNRLEANKATIIFDPDHLSLLSGYSKKRINSLIRNRQDNYRKVGIKKKSGGHRVLELPEEDLKNLQQWILANILENIPVSRYSKAFKKGLSIIDNAKPHLRKECVINIDISNFFWSISAKSIHKLFRKLGYTKEMSSLFTKICTFNNHLPQGAPTSPYLANLVCKSLDSEIIRILKGKKISYTRYADDLTFSGNKDMVNYLDQLQAIVRSQGFQVNDSKTRIQYSNQRQLVTGIIVNRKLSVPKELTKKLRQEIHYCKQFGVNGHMQRREINKSAYKEYLFGIAYFIKMVSPKLGRRFIKQLREIYWEY